MAYVNSGHPWLAPVDRMINNNLAMLNAGLPIQGPDGRWYRASNGDKKQSYGEELAAAVVRAYSAPSVSGRLAKSSPTTVAPDSFSSGQKHDTSLTYQKLDTSMTNQLGDTKKAVSTKKQNRKKENRQ